MLVPVYVFLLVVCPLLCLTLLWRLGWFHFRPSSSPGATKRTTLHRQLQPRYHTPLYRLKTPSHQIAVVLAALAEGLDASAAERVAGLPTSDDHHLAVPHWRARSDLAQVLFSPHSCWPTSSGGERIIIVCVHTTHCGQRSYSHKHEEVASLGEEKAALDYLVIKISSKASCRSLIDFSTMSNGSTPAHLALRRHRAGRSWQGRYIRPERAQGSGSLARRSKWEGARHP